MPFMNKALPEEIMTGTRLRNKFLKHRSEKKQKEVFKTTQFL